MPPRYLTLQKTIVEDPHCLFDKDLKAKYSLFIFLC
jgi:hypothetical protein